MEYVLVTTEYKGVFAGELKEKDAEAKRVVLKNARCAIQWATTKGFFELAELGPNVNSKIGSTAPTVELFGVTSISACTETAKKAWIDA